MYKIFAIGASLVIPVTLFAEANINTDENLKSFLLTAPGTLTGKTQKEEPPVKENTSRRPAARMQQPLRFKPGRYRKGGESYKFPQYGQVNGGVNPWSETELNRRLPPALPPASPNYSNPWDLGGKLPPQSGPNSYNNMYNPGFNQGYGPYGYSQNMNPGFPGDIYRDTNPAASMPFFNGVMPGMGGDNNGFPFSPFGMF